MKKTKYAILFATVFAFVMAAGCTNSQKGTDQRNETGNGDSLIIDDSQNDLLNESPQDSETIQKKDTVNF